MGKVIGIDLGGTFIKFGLFSEEGENLDKWSVPTPENLPEEQMIIFIADEVHDYVQRKNLSIEQIDGVGMGVPGAVTEDGVVIHAPNIGWHNFAAAACLEKKLGCPVRIVNDANAAALGELYAGSAKGCRSMVFVTLGTGVGGAIISHGHLLGGSHGGAGEVGHMTVRPQETRRCSCGKCGCLEQYSSASGIARLAHEQLQNWNGETCLRGVQPLTAKEVFDAVKQHDALALSVAEEFGEMLGLALSQVATVVDPDLFVIGGGVSKAGPCLLEFVQKWYRRFAFTPFQKTGFAIASLKNDAGIYGAMSLFCACNSHRQQL